MPRPDPHSAGPAPAATRTAPPAAPCRLCGATAAHFQTTRDGRHYQRCRNCGITQLTTAQLPRPEEEQALYRLHRNDPADPGYRRFSARLATPLCARLAPASRGLDYGCGPGSALAALLCEAGHRITLYDPVFAPEVAALSCAYDFIACCEVAEHFHHPAREFDRLDALLRPGGWLAIMTGYPPGDEAFEGWHYRRDPTHVAFYGADTFAWLAASRGWGLELPDPNIALLRKAAPPHGRDQLPGSTSPRRNRAIQSVATSASIGRAI